MKYSRSASSRVLKKLGGGSSSVGSIGGVISSTKIGLGFDVFMKALKNDSSNGSDESSMLVPGMSVTVAL